MRRTLLLAFAAYFLLGTAWALALPVNGTYDEKQHLVRAYAVWTGQWLPHGETLDATGYPASGFTGPRSLLPANADCTWHPKPAKPASCLEMVDDRTETVVPSAAGRYSPVYYALVGLPIRVSPDETGIVWSRVLSASLSALLLAAATAIGAAGRNRLLVAAVALVSTPLAMNLNGSINPNGLEISAGVLLFAALLSLVRASGPPPRLLLGAAGAAGALLLTVRNLGPVLCALALLAIVVVAPSGRARQVVRDRDTWRWFAAPLLVGGLFAVFWTLVSRITDVAPVTQRARPSGSGEVLRGIVDGRAEFWIRQVVAQFNYGETTVSIAMIGVWYLLVAALVAPALWFGDRRLRVSIVGVVLACAALLVGMELVLAPRVGAFSHGRYVMPLLAGAVLMAAFAERYAAWLTDRGWLDRLALVLVLATVPLDLYALARVMTRFQHGINAGLDPFGGSWQPVYGSVVPLVACLVGGALLAVIVTRSSVRPTAVHSTVNTFSN